jgi:hypothetical protein
MSRSLCHLGKLAWQARYWRLHGQVRAAERIEQGLADAGRCKRCGCELTDPVSLEHGVGPECVKKHRR